MAAVQPPAAQAPLPLKFFLLRRNPGRKGEVREIRRLRVAGATLHSVRELAEQWAKRDSLSVSYYDDEGDLIRMETEEEWHECVRLWGGLEKPLSLYIEPLHRCDEVGITRSQFQRQRQQQQSAAAGEGESSGSPASGHCSTEPPRAAEAVAAPQPETETEQPAAKPEAETVQPAAKPEAETEQPAAKPEAETEQPAAKPEADTEQPAAKPEAAEAGVGQEPEGKKPAAVCVVAGHGQQQQVLSLALERLFGGDVFGRLSAGGVTPADLGAGAFLTVQRRHDLGRGDVDIDVDMRGLAAELNARACALIDAAQAARSGGPAAPASEAGRALVAAEEWLRLARELAPADAAAVYNAACVRALRGDAELALGALSEAIDLGYSDGAHMAADPDLAALRGDPRFAMLVNCIGGAPPPAGAGAAPAAEAGPAPGAGGEHAEELRQLRAMGLADGDRAAALLAAHGGDLHAAVCALLDGF